MPTYSDAELLAAIDELAEKYGRPPTLQEATTETRFSRSVFYSHFGSWRDALEEAGYDSRPPQEAIPKQDLIDELQRLGDNLGHQPTLPDMNEHGEYWGSTYKNHFESWAAAIEAAGFDPERVGQKIGREALRDELVRLGESLGKRPTYREMAAEGAYDPKTYIREYGSWTEALEAADFEPPTGVREDDLRTELERLADDLGKQPSQRDMNDHGKHSHTTYVRQYGSWSKALDAVLGDD